MSRVAVYGSFEGLPKPYEEVFRHAGTGSGVFLSLPWFRHLAATVFGKNNDFRIYGVESDSGNRKPYLVLPMRYQVSRGRLFRLRRLAAVSNYYSVLFSPLVGDPDSDLQANLGLIAKSIAAERPRWDVVDIHPMEADTPQFDGTMKAFSDAGMLAQNYFCFGNWYLSVNNRSYAEYSESLPSKLKNTLKRKSRQLEEENRLRIEIFSDGIDLGKGLDAYEKIYSSSWKKPESHPTFVRGLIHICAEQGSLRLGVAYIDERPAAAQLWIVSNRVASIYKLAYDEQFSKFSVGTILTARLMQHVIDVDLVREVDYLSGDDPYKRDWMSHRRERRGVIAFNPRTVFGALAAVKHFAGRARNVVVRSSSRDPLNPISERAAALQAVRSLYDPMGGTMQHLEEVRNVLSDVLGLDERRVVLSKDSALLGAIPELDSMAVVNLLTALEEHFGITVNDDEISAANFETLDSLARFVQRKLA